MTDHETILARNLGALERRSPDLARRLTAPVRAEHLRVDDEGWAVRHGHAWQPLGLDRGAVASAARATGDAGVLVLGIGAGELVDHALDHGVPRVHAWEPDPWSLRSVLSRRDWSAELLSGRLRLALGVDLLRLDRGLPRWRHPVLARLHGRDVAAFDHGGDRALVVAGEMAVDDLVHALARTGTAAWTLHATRDSVEELERTVHAVGARRVYSINYVEGLAEFCDEHGLELFVWEIDASTARPRELARPLEGVRIFCHRRANVGLWRDAGYVHVDYLPLAADPERRRPLATESVDARYRSHVAFVGSSLASNAEVCRARFLDGLTRGHGLSPELASEVLEGLLARQAAEPDAYLLPDAWAASPFAADGDAAFHGEDPVMLVAEVAASARRLAEAASLADLGLVVWGDEGWGAVDGLDARGPAGHHRELDFVFAGADLVLDLARLYQRDIVTLRVFDALSLVRPVLTPWSEALGELFVTGKEVLAYRSGAELRRLVEDAADRGPELAEIARRGRDRLLREHTYDHRLEAMHRAAERRAA